MRCTMPFFKLTFSLGFITSSYVIFSLSMVQAMDIFMITRENCNLKLPIGSFQVYREGFVFVQQRKISHFSLCNAHFSFGNYHFLVFIIRGLGRCIPYSTLTPRRLRPIRVANKTQTRDPLNFGPCKADWPAAFVIK